jgi:hypothetical protein
LVYGLMRAGSREEAMAAAKGLIIAADTIPNPWAHSYALLTGAMPILSVLVMPCRGAW